MVQCQSTSRVEPIQKYGRKEMPSYFDILSIRRILLDYILIVRVQKKNIFGNEIPCSLHSIFVLCTGLCSYAYVSGILYIFAAGGDDVSFSIIHNVKHKFGLWMLHESSRNTIFNICHVQNAYRTLLSSQFLHCILLYTCHRINAIQV